jgi:hypothetical protein
VCLARGQAEPLLELSPLVERLVEVVAEAVASGLVEVAVAVGGGADGGVAEVVLDLLQVRASCRAIPAPSG